MKPSLSASAGCALTALILAAGCPAQEAEECQLNSECAEGQVCQDGKCHTGCQSTRDCPAGQMCDQTAGACVVPDGGGSSSGGTTSGSGSTSGTASASSSSSGAASSSSSSGGTVTEGQSCNPVVGDCLPGLVCVNFGAPSGTRCAETCDADSSGTLVQSTCPTGMLCYGVNVVGDITGVCIRTAGRDEACLDPFEPDPPPVFCDEGLTRLVDNVDNPFTCGCKLLCEFATCPGAGCPCPQDEICVQGVLTGNTTGACGTTIPTGADCSDPFDYPFTSSEYCAPAMGLPQGAPQPIPYCYYEDFDTFRTACTLICQYDTVLAPCPLPLTCQDASDVWGEGVRTCKAPPGPPDAGVRDASRPDATPLPDANVVTLPDGGLVDAGGVQDGSVDGGASSSAAVDAGPGDGGP